MAEARNMIELPSFIAGMILGVALMILAVLVLILILAVWAASKL